MSGEDTYLLHDKTASTPHSVLPIITAGEQLGVVSSSPIKSKYAWPALLVLSALSIGSGAGQAISLPLWLQSFGTHLGGPYAILLASSIFYFVFFGVLMLIARFVFPSVTFLSFRIYWRHFVAIGFFDALNGLMIVYTSDPNRVPPVLSALFGNVSVLFAMGFTWIFIPSKRNISYKNSMVLSALFILLIGIVFSLLPTIIAVASGKEKFASGPDNFFYTIIFLTGVAPGVLYNILQERLLVDRKDDPDLTAHRRQGVIDQLNVLFWGCLFQLVTMSAFFWVDIIPHYGASKNVHDFWQNLSSSLKCMMHIKLDGGGHCPAKVPLFGILFNVSYAITYLSVVALNEESTNYATVAGMIASPLVAIFWIVFPKLVPQTTHTPLWSILPALILIVVGSALWKLWEKGLSWRSLLNREWTKPTAPIN